MRYFLIVFLFIQLCNLSIAQNQTLISDAETDYYTNPIFTGDYPDPSILCDGENYYIVHSSFEYYPGLLIWHSTDLINWTPVVNALQKYVGSVYAPDLVKHNNKYFIYFPASGTNYVVWADSITGPWSDPVDLQIGNIDPGHVVDEDGKRYLYFSNGGYLHLSDDGLKVEGNINSSYTGWPIPKDWTIECFCLEGPKLVKRDKYYFLTVAEGGTAGPATGHMVVSARSESPLGPWENSPYNPIARTASSNEKWWSVGHATLFDDGSDNWWMVLHGYENGHYNMGRQTLLLPVEWTDNGWYKIPEGIKIDQPIKRPMAKINTSQYNLSDSFNGNDLKPQWKFFKEYDTSRFYFEDNSVAIKAKGNSVANCSPMLAIPGDHSYDVQVEVYTEGKAIGGLVLFYNEKAHSGILAEQDNILTNLRGWQFVTENNVINNHVFLRLKNKNNIVNMYYSIDGTEWHKVETSLEVSSFHHNALSEFLSLRIGLCSMGEGVVKFKNFQYTPINDK